MLLRCETGAFSPSLVAKGVLRGLADWPSHKGGNPSIPSPLERKQQLINYLFSRKRGHWGIDWRRAAGLASNPRVASPPSFPPCPSFSCYGRPCVCMCPCVFPSVWPWRGKTGHLRASRRRRRTRSWIPCLPYGAPWWWACRGPAALRGL